MRAQDQEPWHLKEDEQDSGGCEQFRCKRDSSIARNRDAVCPEKKNRGDVIGHQ